MRKIIFIVLTLSFFCFSAYALDTKIVGMRNKFFEESKAIKTLLANSKDMILLNSMWDSCIMTMTQLDAYFSMVGIFNTIKKETLTEEAINYITNWLEAIKKTNDLNIKSLNAITNPVEPKTKIHMEKLRGYFNDLNNQINTELNKISIIKKLLKTR